MAWLTGWDKRKTVVASRTSGAVTNYQIKILVGESSGSSGAAVHCNALGNSDFSDIRFTAADGTTLLDYWVESVAGTTPNQIATVWVEFNSIGTTATTFYLYYGNTGATSASNGDSTFPFFDDFSGTTLNTTTKWSVATPYDAGSYSVSGGILTINAPASGMEACVSKNKLTGSVRARIKFSGKLLGFLFGFDQIGVSNYFYIDHGTSPYFKTSVGGNNQQFNFTATDEFVTDYAIVDLKRFSPTSGEYRINNVLRYTATNYVDTAAIYLTMAAGYGLGRAATMDWVFNANFLAVEPVISSFGVQEDIVTNVTVSVGSTTISPTLHPPSFLLEYKVTIPVITDTTVVHTPLHFVSVDVPSIINAPTLPTPSGFRPWTFSGTPLSFTKTETTKHFTMTEV